MDYIFQHHKVMDLGVTLDRLETADREALLKSAKDGFAKTEGVVGKIEGEVRSSLQVKSS